MSPKLNTTAPIRLGLATIGVAAMLGAGLFFVDVDQGPVAVATSIKRAEPVAVRHETGGTLARLHVAAGTEVVTGALIAELDRRHIENELAGLRKRVDARRMEIDGLRQESAALSAAGDKTAVRSRIAALDAEVVEADRAIIGHSARIALLEGQLDRLEIRAPVAGRVTDLPIAAGAVVSAKAPVAIIRPSMNRLQIDVVWPASAGAMPAVGQSARIWQSGSLGLVTAQAGKVESIGADIEVDPRATGALLASATASNDTRARIALDVSGTPLAEQRPSETSLNIQLVTGSKSLAAHLIAPLIGGRGPLNLN